MKPVFLVLTIAISLAAGGTTMAADKASFEGFKVCAKCHDRHEEEWRKTSHAKAFDSLKPNVKAAAKEKAKLDPAKDYTQDKDCLGCHVTGYGEAGGYRVGMPAAEASVLAHVTCESCHGPGSIYRKEHGEAQERLKRQGNRTERKVLPAMGQYFDYATVCARCHLNYQGSGWTGAKPPYTPFTPAVDGKYKFDFDKAVRDTSKAKGVHVHFKLQNIFTGDPVPPFRAELQKDAKSPDED